MTAFADIGPAPRRAAPSLREVGLWMGAALVAVVMHAMVGYGVHVFQPGEPPAEAAEPALMIDLTPLMVSTPETIESETITEETPKDVVQPVEDVTEIADLPEPEPIEPITPEVVPETVEPEAVETLEPEILPETAEPETAEAVTPEVVEPEKPEPELAEPTPVAPEPTAPEVVTAVTPEVVLPLPEPRPVVNEEPKKKAEPRKKAETKKTEKVEKATTKKKVEKQETKRKQVAKAEPAPKSKASIESRASKAPKVSPAKWKAQLNAWIRRYKPRGAKSSGKVQVRFTVNASGAVISAGISHSSGHAELDQIALNMVRRASPFPAPPPGTPRSAMSITLPMVFN